MTPLEDRLAGTFELVSLVAVRSDGDVSHPFGAHPIGLFVFDRAGRFSVQLTDPETDASAGRYVAMFGTYVVDDAAATFTLTPAGGLDPAAVGRPILRHVEPGDGEIAVFRTPPSVVDGLTTTTSITWRRVT